MTPLDLPGPRSAAELERLRAVLYPGIAEDLAPFVLDRKRGATVTDLDGNEFIDLISGSASVPLGAAREELIEPLVAALRRFGNEDGHSIATDQVLPLAERLLAVTPDSLTRIVYALNGTEAVETAVKVMRRATRRPIVIGFLGGYHGETVATATLGAEENEISAGMRALVPGFAHVPYPNPYRSPFGPPRPGGSGDSTVDYIRDHLLFHAIDPREVAGVVIEPILGSGGCVAPPESFWTALVELCREFDWLLCADEVKCGMGRSGEMFAVERWGVEPDLMCLGKALGGGVAPIGALLGSERAVASFDDIETGSTWSWLPWACAAASATLDLYEREPVLENVRALEAVGLEKLGALAERHPQIGEVRVIGGFQAIELVRDPATKERDGELQRLTAEEAMRRGVLTTSSSTSLNIQPSLMMDPGEFGAALDVVAESLATAIGELGR
jgi:4-aminobutyrate aminotransferase-like enzyme